MAASAPGLPAATQPAAPASAWQGCRSSTSLGLYPRGPGAGLLLPSPLAQVLATDQAQQHLVSAPLSLRSRPRPRAQQHGGVLRLRRSAALPLQGREVLPGIRAIQMWW